jgi:GH24 family phage-related lysozyme (muramidase)
VRPSVRAAFLAFTTPLEGCCDYLYADVLGLITTGIGNLVDPLSAAQGLPWVRPDGSRATGAEIATAWLTVKGDPQCARQGHRYARSLTTIRLTPEGVERLVYGKLDANDRFLAGRFADFDEWPACAQLAVHSLAWACGPSFRFPKLEESLRARDFDAAAVHVAINEWSKLADGTPIHNSGLVPRNRANKTLMRNASRVQAFMLDPELLEWTRDLGVADEPTQPELLPQLVTPIMGSRFPPRPSTPADHPTVAPQAIIRADPSAYLRPKEFLAGVDIDDPEDPEAA